MCQLYLNKAGRKWWHVYLQAALPGRLCFLLSPSDHWGWSWGRRSPAPSGHVFPPSVFLQLLWTACYHPITSAYSMPWPHSLLHGKFSHPSLWLSPHRFLLITPDDNKVLRDYPVATQGPAFLGLLSSGDLTLHWPESPTCRHSCSPQALPAPPAPELSGPSTSLCLSYHPHCKNNVLSILFFRKVL